MSLDAPGQRSITVTHACGHCGIKFRPTCAPCQSQAITRCPKCGKGARLIANPLPSPK